jgi:hypothetical protein
VRAYSLSLLILLAGAPFVSSADTIPPDGASLDLQIRSSQSLSGTAGDYITVKASIRNVSASAISNVTTYLSLVDEGTKLPVDLEDWSAEKGLFIGVIDSAQTLPLDWKIHLVKAGSYSLIIVAETAGDSRPQTSSIVHFTALPKRNLNPGHVLPVALLTPVVILCIMALASYARNSRLRE